METGNDLNSDVSITLKWYSLPIQIRVGILVTLQRGDYSDESFAILCVRSRVHATGCSRGIRI